MYWIPILAALTQDVLAPTDGGRPIEIVRHDVDVGINNGIAVTRVTMVFRNPEPRPREAMFSFPVPGEASVSNFSLWVNGAEMHGEVLERRRARTIYEDVVSKQRQLERPKDPGLLEQVSYKLFQARIFPVPASGTQQVRIEYYQPLDYDGGFITYTYPMKERAAKVRIDARVLSEIPLVRVTSPSHGDALAVAERSKTSWRASVEESPPRVQDFVLVLELAREQTGLTLVPYAREGEEGYFMMILTAGADLERDRSAGNYLFIVDVSGSMGEERRLEMAVRATESLIQGLEDGDTFNVLAFNIGVERFREKPVPADRASKDQAKSFLRGLRARGATDLVPALQSAAGMLSKERANVVLLLSDGNATDSEDHSGYRELVDRKLPVRIFTLGIGNEVNRPLLGTLAERTGGYADFVSSWDDIDRKLALLRQKSLHRVAEDLDVRIEGVDVSFVTPERFTNLFRGSQSILYGRYNGSGKAKVTVEGTIGGKRRTIAANVEFPRTELDNPEVCRMWAWKRTDDLMREIRLRGEAPRAVREITDLGTQYSIVTPYTSFLVLESDGMYREYGIDRRNARQIEEDRAAQNRRNDRPTARQVDFPSRSGDKGGSGGGSVGLGFLVLAAAFAAGRLRRCA